MTDAIEDEVRRVGDYLANVPQYGSTTVSRVVLRKMLLDLDGYITSRGRMWDICSKYLGAGVYRVWLEERARALPPAEPAG